MRRSGSTDWDRQGETEVLCRHAADLERQCLFRIATRQTPVGCLRQPAMRRSSHVFREWLISHARRADEPPSRCIDRDNWARPRSCIRRFWRASRRMPRRLHLLGVLHHQQGQ